MKLINHVSITRPIYRSDGTLNAFQPVEGGFEFVGHKDDASKYMYEHKVLIDELVRRRMLCGKTREVAAREVIKMLFHDVLKEEQLKEIYSCETI